MTASVDEFVELGEVTAVPGDKSIATRALLLALFADGPSFIHNPPASRTTRRVVEVVRALGATVIEHPTKIEVRPASSASAPSSSSEPLLLFCGGSATLARIVIGIAAGLGLDAVVDGSPMLRQRPMDRVRDPMNAWFGRDVVTLEGNTLPARIHAGPPPPAAPLIEVLNVERGVVVKQSAQVRSALTYAAIAARRPFPLREDRRGPWRQHLEELCSQLGIHGRDPVVRAFHVTVPADPSAAAFPLALAAALPHSFPPGAPSGNSSSSSPSSLTIRDLYMGRARTGLWRAMAAMGARIDGLEDATRAGNAPTGRCTVVGGAPLRGIELAADPIPVGALTAGPHVLCGELYALIDEVPVLAMLCALATTPSRLCGLKELRVKESDRVSRTAELLQAFGAAVVEEGDDLIIEPSPLRRPTTVIRTDHDHRIAMTAWTLALILGFDVDDIALDDESCADESWPGFKALMQDLARRLRRPQ